MYRQFTSLFFLFGIGIACCRAQQINTPKHFQFHSINSVSLLEGQVGASFQLQTINGAQYKSWFAGAGIGLDYYRIRTIPFFIDLRKEFGKSRSKFFVFADGGIDFSWATDKEKIPYTANDKFSNGFYRSAGGGYKIAVNRNNSLLMDIGYSLKNSKETYRPPVLNYYGPEALWEPQQQVNYNLSRVIIKIGWEF